MGLLRKRQADVRRLLKKVTLAEVTGAAVLHHDCFQHSFVYGLIKSNT